MPLELMLEHKRITKTLTVLSASVRLDIVFLLGTRGRLNVGQIAENFRLSRPAISHHLRALREAEIVETEKMGQEVYYWLNSELLISQLQSLTQALTDCPPTANEG